MALEEEVRDRSTKKVLAKALQASEVLKKVSERDWTESIRKSRDER